MTTGKDLKLRRIALDVQTGELAERIGVPPSTISRWESGRRVTDKAAVRYLTGLATFGTIPIIDVSEPEAVAL